MRLFVSLAVIFLSQFLLDAKKITPTDDTPKCVSSCVKQSCADLEITCVCEKKLTQITDCVISECSEEDQKKATEISKNTCRLPFLRRFPNS